MKIVQRVNSITPLPLSVSLTLNVRNGVMGSTQGLIEGSIWVIFKQTHLDLTRH